MIALATLASLAMIVYGVSGLFHRRPADTTPARTPIDPNYYPKPWRG